MSKIVINNNKNVGYKKKDGWGDKIEKKEQ